MLKGHQPQALEFLNSWFTNKTVKTACLEGYAGVGKTFIVSHWLETLAKDNPKIRICVTAPTHKALDVLRKKIKSSRISFMTLHSLLGIKMHRDEDGELGSSRREVRTDFELVACDEASMVNEELNNALLSRKLKTLFIGDPAQLPPVKEDMSPTFKTEYKFTMTEVVRQENGNPIIEIATKLREVITKGGIFTLGDVPPMIPQGNRQISFITHAALHQWAFVAHEKGKDARIMCWDNASVAKHNAAMHRMCFPDTPLYGVGELILVNEAFTYCPPGGGEDDEILITNGTTLKCVNCTRVDDICGVTIYEVEAVWSDWQPVKITTTSEDGEEDEQVEEVPGSMKFKVALNEAHMTAVKKGMTDEIWRMRRAGEPREAIAKLVADRKPLLGLAPFRHSYSCTVHKSQGSTYDIAFVDWASIYRSDDRYRLLYVATTRPSDFLVIVKKD